MNVLVTGGAGFVGSVVVQQLLEAGHRVVIIDDLRQGHRKAVLPDATLIEGSFGDTELLGSVFQRYDIEAVMHMAAETVIEHSMTDPERYFLTNVVDGISLLRAMRQHGVERIIFSSTAAVYGEPQRPEIEEDHPKVPTNSYGESKLMFEHILAWYGKAYGLKHLSFRYFNAAGASGPIGEDHRPETHLLPNILRCALKEDHSVSVFGTDYPTRDGSCIRDFVHVRDIADAHLLGLSRIDQVSGEAYNLGSGDGLAVLEVISVIRRATGRSINVVVQGRRPGDPAVLVANATHAREDLGWTPQHSTLEEIVESAWLWMREHPHGYAH